MTTIVHPVGTATEGNSFSFDIALVGLGYVGLPTMLGYVNSGLRVVGFDISVNRIQAIRNGAVDLIPTDKALLESHDLNLTNDASVLGSAAAVIIAVPTPTVTSRMGQFTPDLSILTSACETVVSNARPGQVIILTSTTYIGCTEDLLVKPLANAGLFVGRDIHVAYSPERIDPANTTWHQGNTPRVFGGFTEACADRAEAVLSAAGGKVTRVPGCREAEAVKLLENTFRAVNLAFINEFADAMTAQGIDISTVIDGAATKPYGFMEFRPGPGVGGHCIPEDPHYLMATSPSLPIVSAAMQKIHGRPRGITSKALGVTEVGSRVLLLGASYKPGVADLRVSPALAIAEGLVSAGRNVEIYDPYVPEYSSIPDGDFDLVVVAHGGLAHLSAGRAPITLDASFSMDSKGCVRP